MIRSQPPNQNYRDNFDRIFAKKKPRKKWVPCPTCEGLGYPNKLDCQGCGGTGKVEAES